MSRTLIAVSGLTHGLAHQLRTSLSVIQNELSYIKPYLAPGECDRALERCNSIASYLKELATIGGPQLTLTLTSLQKISDCLVEILDVPPLQKSNFLSTAIMADLERLQVGFQHLSELLHECGANDSSKIVLEYVIVNQRAHIILKTKVSLYQHARDIEYASLTEFFNLSLGKDNCHAPITDTLLWAHQAEILVSLASQSELTVDLSFACV